ncbi:hypothetical protein D3C87_241620 [compost metagenome]
MDDFLNSLPKPVLVLGAIIIGIIVFMLIDPPHTVCDTQQEAMKEHLKGSIFSSEAQKGRAPPVVARAKEACQLGNSGGSCYEYFSILKQAADAVGKASGECTAQLYNVPEVSSALNDGIELMARMAWGTQPPERGFARFGWMQESELATFCRLKGIYIRAKGEQAWTALRGVIFGKLPGEAPVVGADPTASVVEPKMAPLIFSEQEIWERSLFSIRCESFL